MRDLLPNIQDDVDKRGIYLDSVGIRNFRYPIMVNMASGDRMPSVGRITFTVDVAEEVKGTHMSRLVEIIQSTPNTDRTLATWARECQLAMLTSVNGHRSTFEIFLPYAIQQTSPVSKKPGQIIIDCRIASKLVLSPNGTTFYDVITQVTGIGTSLCPCSREISENGAHNQRSKVTLAVKKLTALQTIVTPDVYVPFEDLYEVIEKMSSCPIYNLLKRPDEKWVTETAYDHPKFVEDMIRDGVLLMKVRFPGREMDIEVCNEESIHAQDAYARWYTTPLISF